MSHEYVSNRPVCHLFSSSKFIIFFQNGGREQRYGKIDWQVTKWRLKSALLHHGRCFVAKCQLFSPAHKPQTITNNPNYLVDRAPDYVAQATGSNDCGVRCFGDLTRSICHFPNRTGVEGTDIKIPNARK
jgi:hypothetical protein